MNIEDAAWLAGYIDGDGCISLSANGGRKWRSPILVIDSTDVEILDEVQRLCGGRRQKKTKALSHHRQAWSWRLTGADAIIALLTKIRPFMRCAAKAERADLLINKWRICTPPNGYYTEEQAIEKTAFESKFLSTGSGRGSTMRRPSFSLPPLSETPAT